MRSRTDFESVHAIESQQSYRRPVSAFSSPGHTARIPQSPLGPNTMTRSPYGSPRPPLNHSPGHHMIQGVSPYRLPARPVNGYSPNRIILVPSPSRLQSVSPFRPIPPSARKRARSESSSSSSSDSDSSDFEYSSSSDSDDERSPSHKIARVGKPPSPPKYFPNGPDEEDIGSSDSDYEDDDGSNDRYDDLRDFIDFDPKFNKKVITKREAYSRSDDPLREFLFNHDSKSRKWFRTFAWAAVGSKLSKKNTES